MRYPADHGVRSYAVSARGHDASWHPSFLQMLYVTTKRELANDLVAGIRAVQSGKAARSSLLATLAVAGWASSFSARAMLALRGWRFLGPSRDQGPTVLDKIIRAILVVAQ
ncbi:hypothetical protein ANO14919_053780 [Xylariales sp. No.14919]|nr:hypothetical protein ANO14919_053780 [Xylariales sp. No.14919]